MILKKNKFKPYKIRKVNSLHPGDANRRLDFCYWYLRQLDEDHDFFKKIIWTDAMEYLIEITTDFGVMKMHMLYWQIGFNKESLVLTFGVLF